MTVKFAQGVSNTERDLLITNANLDLVDASVSNIPDVIILSSRLIPRTVSFYPCGNPIDDLYKQPKTPIKGGAQLRPIDPIPCNPYYITYYESNYYSSLLSLLGNSLVVSASNTIIRNSLKTGTDESFYIKIKSGYSINDFTSLLNTYNLTYEDLSSTLGNQVYKIVETRESSRFCLDHANLFFETGMCDFSHPDFIDFKALRSNDPLFSQQTYLKNTGQSGGIGTDLRAEKAWQITKGSPSVKVAVLDNGVELTHPDLEANLVKAYTLSGTEYPGNASSRPVTADARWDHGTCVAGIIAAVADNNVGISGIAPNCRIMPFAITGVTSTASSSVAIGIALAVYNGASIINMSVSVTENDLVKQQIDNAVNNGRNGLGCLMFCPTGNSVEDADIIEFPANLSTVFAVGSMTYNNKRENTVTCGSCSPAQGTVSHYGEQLDFVAPALSGFVTTTTFSNNNGGYTGDFGATSGATAMASGVAALMLSVNPTLTWAEAARILRLSCNRVGAYCYNWSNSKQDAPWNNEMGYGRLNAYNAVQLARPGITISQPVLNQLRTQDLFDGGRQITIQSGGCVGSPYLAFGQYYTDRYKSTLNINFPSTQNPYVIASSNNGFSAANPLQIRTYAHVTNVFNQSATLTSWYYNVWGINGQYYGVINPGGSNPNTNVEFSYCVVGSTLATDYEVNKVGQATNSSKEPFALDIDNETVDNSVPTNKNIQEVTLSPNPANSLTFLSVQGATSESIIVEVYSVDGSKKLSFNKNIIKGVTKLPLDISSLIKGNYYVRVTSKTLNKQFKLIKL